MVMDFGSYWGQGQVCLLLLAGCSGCLFAFRRLSRSHAARADKLEDILTAREIRQVTPELLDCFSPPRNPRILPRPTREVAHLYMWIGCQWWRSNRRPVRPEFDQKALIFLGFTYTSRPAREIVITQKRCNSPPETTP